MPATPNSRKYAATSTVNTIVAASSRCRFAEQLIRFGIATSDVADGKRTTAADLRRSCAQRAFPDGSRIAYTIAIPSHGGLTPAAPGRMYVCASQKSLFRRQTFALRRKSGGRKPPVVALNAIATTIRTHTVGGLPTNGARVCRCVFAHPRRADARRSCARRAFPDGSRIAYTIAIPAPRRVDARRTWANVRLCIAKIAVSPADVRTATQERGA
jgi:hypothetical protein